MESDKRIRAFPPPPAPKKPKRDDKLQSAPAEMPATNRPQPDGEHEEILVSLINYQTAEVDRLRKRVASYKSRLKEAKHQLRDTQGRLAHLRSGSVHQQASSDSIPGEANSHLVVPLLAIQYTGLENTKFEPDFLHQDLISHIGKSPLPHTFRCSTSESFPSKHKRRLRNLSLSPTDDTLFATSALDGNLNLWQIHQGGSVASLLDTTDCASPGCKRWPEGIAWYPQGDKIFCAYSADGEDAQVSIVNLNRSQGRAQVTFLEEKPHVKGVINNISFLPMEDDCFITGGTDHAVILWNPTEDGNSWRSRALHKTCHSSAVMGVAGMPRSDIVLSAGADKKIIGFDIRAGILCFRHEMKERCMSVLPNPCDSNLFMVHTRAPENQLHLFDIRVRPRVVHSFGWKQESSESQSALINQAWSPDGLYVSSGSADPVIHIFDIRCNSEVPSQSIKAHDKRVFKAVWHRSRPLLISISSDQKIGIHRTV